ncbi:MAG TPA: hypothetical protein VJ692_16595 [Nitrospiraceae bacterium]|nr:hypothetical protein [Nitrospiraceae bacterium]
MATKKIRSLTAKSHSKRRRLLFAEGESCSEGAVRSIRERVTELLKLAALLVFGSLISPAFFGISTTGPAMCSLVRWFRAAKPAPQALS